MFSLNRTRNCSVESWRFKRDYFLIRPVRRATGEDEEKDQSCTSSIVLPYNIAQQGRIQAGEYSSWEMKANFPEN
jgi:hypothetical protein